MKIKNIITTNHLKTKREYLPRMNDNKINCMKIARKFDFNYWDGERKFGYGGYKYMPGHWTGVAKKIIKSYNLNSKSKILDAGCGKGFLLYEIKKLIPNIVVVGFDISKYAIKNSPRNAHEMEQKKHPGMGNTGESHHEIKQHNKMHFVDKLFMNKIQKP